MKLINELKGFENLQEMLDNLEENHKLQTDKELIRKIIDGGLGFIKFHTADIERLLKNSDNLREENKELKSKIESYKTSTNILERTYDAMKYKTIELIKDLIDIKDNFGYVCVSFGIYKKKFNEKMIREFESKYGIKIKEFMV